MSLDGSVVVVTGASSGVGRATAHLLAGRGARIALVARNEVALKAALEEVTDLGARAAIYPADVSDATQVEQVAAAVERDLGSIDVWINNAMVSVFSPIIQLRPEEIEQVMAVNYLGSAYGILAALRRMRSRNSGTIVQVGSALAYRAIPLQGPYCASKHAIRGFVESTRVELKAERSNVRITMVQLPGLNTPHFLMARSRMPHQVRPMRPIYSPDVAARAILYAATHPRRHHIVGAVTAATILAQKLVPRALDAYLARVGIASQQTAAPATPRLGNLFEPCAGDPGTEGPFRDEAHRRSPATWLLRHIRSCLAAVAGLTALALWLG